MTTTRRCVAFAATGLAVFLGGCRIAKSPEGLCFSPLFRISINRPGETHFAGGGWHQGRTISSGCTVIGTPIGMSSGCSIACSAPACTISGCTVSGCTAACSAPGCSVACSRGPLVETLPIGANNSAMIAGGMLSSGEFILGGSPAPAISGTPIASGSGANHGNGMPSPGVTTTTAGYPPAPGFGAPIQSAPAMPQYAPSIPANGIPMPGPAPSLNQGVAPPPAPKDPTLVAAPPAEIPDAAVKAAKPIPASVQTRFELASLKDELASGETDTFSVECKNTGGAPATGLNVRIRCIGATPKAIVRQDLDAAGNKTAVGARGRIEGDTVVFDAVETLAAGAGVELQFTFAAKATADGLGKFELSVRHSALPSDKPEEVKERTFRIKK